VVEALPDDRDERPGVESRDVELEAGELRLSGTLWTPERGACPAVVFVHGSGPAGREDWEADAQLLAEHGIAALAYDKPGVGRSSGDWTAQNFDDRADEAVAAVRFVREQAGIDGDTVGLLGASQGGWIAPMAAERSTDVAFVVVGSASGVSPREQDRYRVEHMLRADGFGEADVAAALDAWHDRDDMLRRGVDPAEILAADHDRRDAPWYGYLAFVEPGSFETSQRSQVLSFVQRLWDFEFEPILERCRCPLFAVWGDADTLVPAEKSKQVFERALTKAGNDEFELVVVPGADHGLRGGTLERADVMRLIARWILDRQARTSRPG
jgi:uncharacterized protein